MCLDRSLGDVEIVSDFRVVASLEQQIDDLAFPGPHLAEFLFHKHCTCPIRPGRPQVARPTRSQDASGFGSFRLILHSRGQIAPGTLTNCEIISLRAISLKNGVTKVISCRSECRIVSAFAQYLR